jgi:hypothetical protein
MWNGQNQQFFFFFEETKNFSTMPLMVCTDAMRDAMKTVLTMDIPDVEKKTLVM